MLITDHVRLLDSQLTRVFTLDPALRPDFANAKPEVIAALIFHHFGVAYATREDLLHELGNYKVACQPDVVDFILRVFEGDDERHHLWQRGPDGSYGFYLFDPRGGPTNKRG